mgnify:CR=1 FL=1
MARMDRGFNLTMEEGRTLYKVSGQALTEVKRRGLAPCGRPMIHDKWHDEDGFPILPRNIGNVSDNDIGELYNVFLEWYNYANGQFAVTRNELAVAQKRAGFVLSRLIEDATGTVKEKEAKARSDRRYVEEDASVTELESRRNLLDAKVSEFSQAIKSISRHISIRESKREKFNRGRSITHGGRPAQDRAVFLQGLEEGSPRTESPMSRRAPDPEKRRPPVRRKAPRRPPSG